MSMNFLTDALRRVPEYRALENAVKRGKTPAAAPQRACGGARPHRLASALRASAPA